MKLFEAECEIHGYEIVHRTTLAEDENEAMKLIMDSLIHNDVQPNDIEPPHILKLSCMKDDV